MSGMWQEPVARVLASAGSGDAAVVVGTGTLVATPQYAVCLLTAAHVVNGALKNRFEYTADRPGSEELLRFDLPMKGTGAGRTYVARIIEWFPPRPREKRVEDPVSDIALLQVVGVEGVAGGSPLPGGLGRVQAGELQGHRRRRSRQAHKAGELRVRAPRRSLRRRACGGDGCSWLAASGGHTG
jgi:hypothetical protein